MRKRFNVFGLCYEHIWLYFLSSPSLSSSIQRIPASWALCVCVCVDMLENLSQCMHKFVCVHAHVCASVCMYASMWIWKKYHAFSKQFNFSMCQNVEYYTLTTVRCAIVSVLLVYNYVAYTLVCVTVFLVSLYGVSLYAREKYTHTHTNSEIKTHIYYHIDTNNVSMKRTHYTDFYKCGIMKNERKII